MALELCLSGRWSYSNTRKNRATPRHVFYCHVSYCYSGPFEKGLCYNTWVGTTLEYRACRGNRLQLASRRHLVTPLLRYRTFSHSPNILLTFLARFFHNFRVHPSPASRIHRRYNHNLQYPSADPAFFRAHRCCER